MLETIVIIAAILAMAIAVIPILAARKPDTFRVERVININAPADKVFPLINDFHRWTKWSPYEGKDPAMKRSYGGAPNGVGAVYGWEGNNNVGSGRMETLQSAAPSKIVIKLDFHRPFEGHNTAAFTMLPQGDSTMLSWLMYGPAPFKSKLMQVFLDLDRMVGRDFEAGLVNLKQRAER
jgi:uncharacterized protein YndB with AHSA1/START domain